jgi:hypothetical protein
MLLSSNMSLNNTNNLGVQSSLSLAERFVQGLKLPQLTLPVPDQITPEKALKRLEKMRGLASCQERFMRVVFNNVDRRSKYIKKHEKTISESLKRRRGINLEEENFDILDIL